jgi:hypothetical protein
MWEAQTGQEILTLKGAQACVCFSPDSRRLASASADKSGTGKAGEVKVWEAQTGQATLSLQGYTSLATCVSFSPDGARVVAANEQGQVHSWDALTGQEVVPCTDPPPAQQPEAVSPDGHRIVRINDGQPVVEPRMLHTGDLFRQRLADPVRSHLWHLGLAREARAGADSFALAFHLEPLLLTCFTQRGARPRDTFPLWAGRPPLSAAEGLAAVGGAGLVPSPARRPTRGRRRPEAGRGAAARRAGAVGRAGHGVPEAPPAARG